MPIISVVLAGIALIGAAPAPRRPVPRRPIPHRIVSLNACADAYVVALADRGQIAALTRYARDPALSTVVAAARTLPFTGGGEEVLAAHPDLIIASPGLSLPTMAMLEGRVPILELPEQNGLAEIERAIAQVAAAVGHPERGRALIAAMRARMARLGPPLGRGRVAAYYQRRGYMTGTGTLVDAMMRRVGLVNLAGVLGKPVLAQVSLEEMAMARPDFLIGENDARRIADEGTAMLHHPLLDRVVPPSRRLYLPQALTVCGTPAYPEAVAMLAAALRAADEAAGSGAR